jgi:lactoylglutathione lyase
VTRFHDAFPILYVDDVARAVEFYESALGFEVSFRWPEDGTDAPVFAFLRLEPLGIGLASRRSNEERFGSDFELCVYADDVDAAAERLRAAGAEELRAPRDEPWGERRAYFRDADGHALHIAARLSS